MVGWVILYIIGLFLFTAWTIDWLLDDKHMRPQVYTILVVLWPVFVGGYLVVYLPVWGYRAGRFLLQGIYYILKRDITQH